MDENAGINDICPPYISMETTDDITDSNIRDAVGMFRSDLRSYVRQCRLNTVQTDGLLDLLNKHNVSSVFVQLPKSHKTPLRTKNNPVHPEIRVVSDHSHFYFGLESQIKLHLSLYPPTTVENEDVLLINWNTDGLNLYNSRNTQFWPFLYYIANLRPPIIFEVVLTAVECKPNDLNYTREFVNELKHLIETGFDFCGKRYRIEMHVSICDAPARAFIKCTKQFSVRYGCDKCDKEGFYDGKRIVWLGVEGFNRRSDATFRGKCQPQYHNPERGDCPLLELGIDMVKQFPHDFMHQGGGTMKKLFMW